MNNPNQNPIEARLRSIESTQEKILNLLAGNSINKNDGGMVGEMASLKERTTKLERFKERGIYILTGVSIGAGWGISDIISKFFNH